MSGRAYERPEQHAPPADHPGKFSLRIREQDSEALAGQPSTGIEMSSKSAILLIAACSSLLVTRAPAQSSADATVPARFPTTWKYPSGGRAAFAEHAMVASSSRAAAEAGLEILKAGGNAVDAAVAVGFALAVVYPEAGNIGGGGYMVIRLADGRTSTLDYRETAPAAVIPQYVCGLRRTVDGLQRQRQVCVRSARRCRGTARGPPKYGVLPLAAVMAPAIRLASGGFPVDSALARSIAGKASVIGLYAGRDVFLREGRAPAIGSRRPGAAGSRDDFVKSRGGANGFYRGKIAELIVAEMQRDDVRRTFRREIGERMDAVSLRCGSRAITGRSGGSR